MPGVAQSGEPASVVPSTASAGGTADTRSIGTGSSGLMSRRVPTWTVGAALLVVAIVGFFLIARPGEGADDSPGPIAEAAAEESATGADVQSPAQPPTATVPVNTPTPAATAAPAVVAPVAEPTPSPTIVPTPTATPAPSATPMPTATAKAIPPPTETPVPTPTSTPAPGVTGIAIATNAGDASTRLAAGDVEAPPVLPAGSTVHATFRVQGFSAGTRVSFIWTIGGETFEGFSDTREQDEVMEISIAPTLGVVGGSHKLEVFAGKSLLADSSFEIDTVEPVIVGPQFATAVDENDLPVDPQHSFAAGAGEVFATLQGYNITPGATLGVRWFINGSLRAESELPWLDGPGSGPGSVRGLTFPAPSTPSGLEAGDFRFIIDLDGREVANDVFKVS